MDNEQLLTFIAVSELKNYSRAADHLNVTQPAVTARIQKLELELDCKLFNRNGKKIILTEEGMVLLPFARKIVNYMNEAKQTVDLLKVPTLSIGLSPAISESLIFQVLSLMKEEHDLLFDIVEADDSMEISKMISEGQIDIGLIRNVVSFTNLESKSLFHEKLKFIVSKKHELADKEEIKLKDLVGQTMICYRRQTPIAVQIDERLVGVENLQRIEVGGFEMVKLMVKNNWGFGIIPELALGIDTVTIKKDYEVIPFPEFDNLIFDVTGIYKNDSPKWENLHLFLHYFETTLKTLRPGRM
ncbi:LysR family transcriptional regulator [Bacillus benzoevorans]|uniref:DNA-binding transcriptional LysR family regulator n=1 Tax=Bacillus benzoevorans TaxID=1456 RepID=A0A7X0LUW4_9BACI|nr:LysR family transcriptional regulator [Bacillus benzoevorans]MBB6445376.1 DNA-binding transcriptional LysR family regulator [Bacillus benzoevorans]